MVLNCVNRQMEFSRMTSDGELTVNVIVVGGWASTEIALKKLHQDCSRFHFGATADATALFTGLAMGVRLCIRSLMRYSREVRKCDRLSAGSQDRNRVMSGSDHAMHL
mgnify:CR=1 FL=1